MTHKSTSECHFATAKEICSDDNVLMQLTGETPSSSILSPIAKKKIVEKLKADTNCESESCIYTHKDIISKLGKDTVKQILDTNFKPEGPYDSTKWLNNNNIDHVLRQNTIKYKKFYAIDYQMIDFAEKGTELATINIISKLVKFNTIGVVLNTDIANGKGKHWFAIFIDARSSPVTIEFFNSSGNLPVHQVQTFLNKTKRDIIRSGRDASIIIVSPNEMQKSDTECGVFSLWFILERLDGKHVEEFKNEIIGPGDEKMIKFRKELFRHSH